MPLYKAGIIDYTWATKPSVAPLGQIICITDVGENGSLWRGNGTQWVKLNAFVLYSNLIPTYLTSTTTETTLATIPIKGGVLGANGKIRFYIVGRVANSGNSKVLRIKHEETVLWLMSYTSAVGITSQILFLNRGGESSQLTSLLNSAGLASTAATEVIPSTVNTSADFSLTVTGQLSNSADFINVTAIFAEIMQ